MSHSGDESAVRCASFPRARRGLFGVLCVASDPLGYGGDRRKRGAREWVFEVGGGDGFSRVTTCRENGNLFGVRCVDGIC